MIGSAAIVPIVLTFVWGGVDSTWLNLTVTGLVGGPHIFSTYLLTYAMPGFRRHHLWFLLAISTAIPALVVIMTLWDFQILLSVFIFSASVHVLHQNAYLTDIYRAKGRGEERRWSRWVDYALLMSSFYPIATHKLVRGSFYLGEVEILIPQVLRSELTILGVWTFFLGAAVVWTLKTLDEWRRSELNLPKTLLIVSTAVIAFVTPIAASGDRLELAFQSVNAWHCLQYLGLTWFILKLRKDRGELGSRFLERLSGTGRPAWRFYAMCVGITAALFGTIVAFAHLDPFRLGAAHSDHFQRYYYMGVLSVLLIHYAIDGYVFAVANRRGASIESMPYSALACRAADPRWNASATNAR